MALHRLFHRLVCCHIVVIVLLLGRSAFSQTTINVPADQPTIQAGINAANNGDTVLVAPGTYIENLNFNGKAITVTSSGGAAVTIVDGNAKAAVATFVSNEGRSSVLNGFTLRNGVPNNFFPIFDDGGGIVIYNASPTITNNVITGNHAIAGIGITAQNSSAVIRGNTITGNTQAGGDGGGGGGIEVLGGAPQIIGNTITNNSMLGGGDGGGIDVFGGSPTIQNNYIAGNSVFNSGGAINIVNGGSSVVVQNIIVNNSAGGGGSGGGINIQTPAEETAVIINNTIVGNTAFDNSSGLFMDVLGSVTISNNIVVAAPGQNAIVCSPFSSIFPAFSHNDVIVSSGGQAWSSNCASFAQSNGNFSADPQFVNAANGNYHLQAGSPAIDAGDNAAPNLPQQDYDDNPRIVDGNNDCVSTIDIGAFELLAAANISLSPASLSFFSQVIGTTSPVQVATLTNNGTTCFQFAGTRITGDFSQVNSCPAAGLPGGSSCAYGVTFTPTASGTRTGTLTVTGSDGATKSAPAVSLSGTGLTPPIASLSPASLNFGFISLGSNSAQVVTLTNTGQVSMSVFSIFAPLPFTAFSSCPASLAPGGACSITVVFAPNSAGTQSALLSVNDNGVGSPQTLSLSGTAVDFSVATSPTSGAIKRGQSIQFKVAVAPVAGPFNPGVSLSCAGLPSFVGCAFSPSVVIPGGNGTSSMLTISSSAKTPRGTFNISVIGQSGSLQHSAPIALTVK